MQEITNDTVLFGYNPEIGYITKQKASEWLLDAEEAYPNLGIPYALEDLNTKNFPWPTFLTEREAEKAFFDEMYSLEAFLHFCKDSGYSVKEVNDLWFELHSTKTMCVTMYDFFKSDRFKVFMQEGELQHAVLVNLLFHMGMEIKNFELVVKDLSKLHGYLANYIRKQQKRIIVSSLEKKKAKLEYLSVAEFDANDGYELKLLTSKQVPLWHKFAVIEDESIVLSAKTREEIQVKIKELGNLLPENVEVFELPNRKIDKVSFFDFPKERIFEIFPKKAITWEVMTDLQGL